MRSMAAEPGEALIESTMVGRDHEVSTFNELLTSAEQGCGRVVLVSGQPGIGKTHLVRALSSQAEKSGALSLIGNCDDDAATPPYWPWLQIMRSIGAHSENTELTRLLRDESILSDALPSDSDVSAKKSTFTAEQPAQVEFRLFNTIVEQLTELAGNRVLLLVLDNLHGADRQSLRLLEFLARQVGSSRLLILGTYRDIAITRKHPLSDTLNTLRRDGQTTRLRLKGLSRRAVAEVVAREVGLKLSDGAIDTIFERTEGNPLFVIEIARGIADELSQQHHGRVMLQIPDGIREAIGRRLNNLPDDCVDLLGIASIIGRVFLLDELAALEPGKSPVEILQTLEPAVTAGILEVDEPSVRLQFSHTLIRDALFEELPIARRLLLHRDFAEALERLHADYPEPALGKIARHYWQAIQVGCVEKAVAFASKAAHHARHVLAFEEAVTYYELAIDALTLAKDDHRRQAAELHLCLGRAHYEAGRNVEANREPLEKAIALAKECGHHECFVDIACLFVHQTLDVPNERALAVCNTALELLPPENTAGRARVTIHKSVALKIIDRRADAEKLVYEAIELARRCNRKDVLCEVLSWGNFSLRGRPEMLSERIALGEQCLSVATELDDLEARVDAMKWLVLSCQEAGDTRRVRQLAAGLKRDSDRYRTVHHRYVSAGVHAYCALMDGDWTRAGGLIEEAFTLGEGSGNEGADGVFGAQMFLLNREVGRLPMFAPVLRRFMADSGYKAWRPALALLLLEVGAIDDAAAAYRVVLERGLDVLPRDELYLATLAFLAPVCVALDDAASAPELYRLLLPYSGQMAVQPTAVCLGPADMYLAELARVANRRDDALRHAEKSLKLAEYADSPPWTAYSQALHAELLAERGDNVDAERTARLRFSARGTAEQLGMVRLQTILSAQEDRAPTMAPNPHNLSPRELEVLSLIAAGRSNKEISRALFISLNTVATHVRSILQKTHSANRTEAAIYARNHQS